MSTLSNLYNTEGKAALDRLHKATGANTKYLYQIAKGIRKPSSKLARKLVCADSSLTIEGLLYPDEYKTLPR